MFVRDMDRRSELEAIAGFILHGGELTKKSDKTVNEQIRHYERENNEIMSSSSSPTAETIEKLRDNNYELQELYLQQGIRIGHKLAMQMGLEE